MEQYKKNLLLQVAEVVLVLFCCALDFALKFDENFSHKTSLLVHGTLVGYCVIALLLLCERMLNTPISFWGDCFYALVGFLMYLSSGCFILHYWVNQKSLDGRAEGIVKGIACIFTGIFFLGPRTIKLLWKSKDLILALAPLGI